MLLEILITEVCTCVKFYGSPAAGTCDTAFGRVHSPFVQFEDGFPLLEGLVLSPPGPYRS